jgi:hypothetical protein
MMKIENQAVDNRLDAFFAAFYSASVSCARWITNEV